MTRLTELGWNIRSVFERVFLFMLILFVFVLPIVIFPNLITANPVIHSKEFVAQSFVSILLVLGCCLWPYWIHRPLDILEIALIGYVVVGSLSAAFSKHFSFCIKDSWLYLSLPILSLVIARIKAIKIDSVLITILVSAIICCLYGISVFAGSNPLEKYLPFIVENQGRNYVHSFLGNPEHFGIYLAPVGVMAMGLLFLRIDSKLIKYLYAFVTLLITGTIVLTGARGALIGMLFGCFIIGYTSYRLSNDKVKILTKRFALAFFVLLAAVIVVFSFPNSLNPRGIRIADRFVELTDIRSASIKERVLFFSVAGQIIKENPVLGTGPGTFKLEFYPAIEKLHSSDSTVAVYNSLLHLKARVAEHAHNDYLEIWADTGLLGISMFLLIPVIVAVWFVRILRMSKQKNRLVIMRVAVIFGAISSIYINALYSFPFHLPVRASMVWILIALYAIACRSEFYPPEKTKLNTKIINGDNNEKVLVRQ